MQGLHKDWLTVLVLCLWQKEGTSLCFLYSFCMYSQSTTIKVWYQLRRQNQNYEIIKFMILPLLELVGIVSDVLINSFFRSMIKLCNSVTFKFLGLRRTQVKHFVFFTGIFTSKKIGSFSKVVCDHHHLHIKILF